MEGRFRKQSVHRSSLKCPLWCGGGQGPNFWKRASSFIYKFWSGLHSLKLSGTALRMNIVPVTCFPCILLQQLPIVKQTHLCCACENKKSVQAHPKKGGGALWFLGLITKERRFLKSAGADWFLDKICLRTGILQEGLRQALIWTYKVRGKYRLDLCIRSLSIP